RAVAPSSGSAAGGGASGSRGGSPPSGGGGRRGHRPRPPPAAPTRPRARAGAGAQPQLRGAGGALAGDLVGGGRERVEEREAHGRLQRRRQALGEGAGVVPAGVGCHGEGATEAFDVRAEIHDAIMASKWHHVKTPTWHHPVSPA